MSTSWYGPLSPTGDRPQRKRKKKTTSTTPISKPAAMSAEEWARLQAEKYIQARIDSINSDRELYLQDLRKQSELEAQRGVELSRVLQSMNLPGKIQQIYGNASADISGLAQAFSGSLKDTAAADVAQQTRMLSGTGQEGAIRNQGEAMGNVVYGLGGYIPGRTMAETGAAFGAQAALEPSFAARIGQQKASEAYQEGLGGLDEFTKAIADARGERFGIEQELLSDRNELIQDQQSLALKAQDTAYKRLKDERDYYMKQAYLSLAAGDRKRSGEYLELARQKEARMTAKDQGLDVNGNPLPGYKIGPDGTVVKVAKPKSPEDKTKGRIKARQEREDEFRKARLDAIDEAKRLIVPATTLRPEQRPSYQVAYSKLWNRYKDLLRFGTSGGQKKLRARLDQLIREALAQNGWVKPEPAKPNQVKPSEYPTRLTG
jgi:hypothetical protein